MGDGDHGERLGDEEGGVGRRHISEGGRVSVRFSLNDGVRGGGGEGGDYSCMSSCSLPSSPPSPSSPIIPSPQAGQLLREALVRYFSSPPDSSDRGAAELCLQVQELFHQLAPRPAGNFVSRDDFEALCSVLGLTAAAPASNHNIGARAVMANTLPTTTESIITSNVQSNDVNGIRADVFVTTTESNHTPAPTKNFVSSAGGIPIRDAAPTTSTKRFTHLLPGIKLNMVLYHKQEYSHYRINLTIVVDF